MHYLGPLCHPTSGGWNLPVQRCLLPVPKDWRPMEMRLETLMTSKPVPAAVLALPALQRAAPPQVPRPLSPTKQPQQSSHLEAQQPVSPS